LSRQFTPSPCKTKNERKKRNLKERQRLERQRIEFEHNTSRGYKVVNTSWLSLSILPFKADMIRSFMILLNKPILKGELQRRLELAFGDLECLKK